ncbi:Sugar transferase involved in LPS biosynthesis (colanic, teichoic acid) [Peptoclostridium litorale DSM 5388]|uniref:Galactosyl transferase CpsE n=1 Tax=Peptoclostridium litorale DSM 5388 TaxID=1121324 RepID=A0A069REL0_PEPLI|nr:sugar transferase [Peptoclostridium litorale]KDR94600.1 galactosyl transferase CpsE [Peptoclostridium litorale DSM 5388]SIO31957.1 Sugar transferase involved in LPS biosynthesis (colanic, teichoic acid) [Peptoclostridium litorale DSM 5388]
MKDVKEFQEKMGKCSIAKEYDMDTKGYIVSKRIMDIILSLAGIVFFFPLFILAALAIKAEDPNGPVIFKQMRVGKNGKTFKMYKFRSMVTDAEQLVEKLMDKNELSGPVFKMKDDPRVTRTGKFIRKTSIDEIPQLINIIMGDMSIVGPRPPLPREVESYTEFQMQRLCVKPGLTCYWQISGRDSISNFDERVALDIKYIRERCLWTDMTIILKTVPALLNDSNSAS